MPKQRDELAAIERHARTELEKWSPPGPGTRRGDGRRADAPTPASEPAGDATTRPREERRPRRERGDRETRRPRHTKPSERSVPLAKLIFGAGRAQGLEPADVIGAIVDETRLEGSDVRNARVLERFSIVEVPRDRAAEVVERVNGKRVRGVELRVEEAKR